MLVLEIISLYTLKLGSNYWQILKNYQILQAHCEFKIQFILCMCVRVGVCVFAFNLGQTVSIKVKAL